MTTHVSATEACRPPKRAHHAACAAADDVELHHVRRGALRAQRGATAASVSKSPVARLCAAAAHLCAAALLALQRVLPQAARPDGKLLRPVAAHQVQRAPPLAHPERRLRARAHLSSVSAQHTTSRHHQGTHPWSSLRVLACCCVVGVVQDGHAVFAGQRQVQHLQVKHRAQRGPPRRHGGANTPGEGERCCGSARQAGRTCRLRPCPKPLTSALAMARER